jgi:hypothetical protein
LLKFGKWFTPNFFVNHFPKTHASPLAPSALSFAQHYKIFSGAFSGMQPNTKKKKKKKKKSFSSENILQCKIFYSKTNGALDANLFFDQEANKVA